MKFPIGHLLVFALFVLAIFSPSANIPVADLESSERHHLSALSWVDLSNPISEEWREIYPPTWDNFNLTSWNDTNADGLLSSSDLINMENLTDGKIVGYHVDNVTVTIWWIWLSPEPPGFDPSEQPAAEPDPPIHPYDWDSFSMDPLGSQWHMIYPTFCRPFNITDRVDLDLDGRFNPCGDDFAITFTDDGTGPWWAHFMAYSTDLVLTPANDVAVTNVTLSRTVVSQGYSASINVTVENQGEFTETFNVTAYANTTIIDSATVMLTAGNLTTLTFTWNPYLALMDKGNYTISAEASIMPGESDTADNSLTDGTVVIPHIGGDIDGDGDVDYDDFIILAGNYGKKDP